MNDSKNTVGIYIPSMRATAKGSYFTRVNGGDWEESPNTLTTEGIAHILNVAMGATAKPTGYYIALFSASVSPTVDWTAASFSQAASEVVSLTEGYTNATRPQWTPTATNTNSIDNFANPARVTIKTASQVTVTGAALLTNSTRGGTTGILVSASKYPAARVLQDGDMLDIGYRVSITV